MMPSKDIGIKKIKTARIKLPNGWKGRVALELNGRSFSKNDWRRSLSQPQLLFENVEKILKKEGRNCVAVKNFAIADSQFKVVIKRHFPPSNLRRLFYFFRPAKAVRNFKTALKLLGHGIPVAVPFAALYRSRNLFISESIYITGYFKNGSNIYTFASDQLLKIPVEKFELRKQLCQQLAEILASLHHNGLWHRDSKASNFIICRDTTDKYRIFLIDMDGIKRYFLRRRHNRLRSLWRLAASLMPVPDINRTDYLRVFKIYCQLTGLEIAQQRQIYRELASRAKAKYLRFMLKARL
jgi:serine/threonine protein kinase